MTSLANLYLTMGKYEDAEGLVQKAVEVNRRKLGQDHSETAKSMQVMAELHMAKGQYSEAEPLAKRALGIREKTFTKDHPSVAESRLSLATLYKNSGRSADAESEYRKAIEIQEKIFGREHLDIAESVTLLGTLYKERGAFKEAEPFFRRALEIQEKAFGRDHPDIAESLDRLGDLLAATGRLGEAEQRYKTALEIREKVYGKDQPFIAESFHNLGVLNRMTGKYDASGHFLQKAYESRVRSLGTNHPKVALSAKELAVLYGIEGKHRESHRFFEQNNRIEAMKRDNVFLILSEREKLRYMKETEQSIHQFLSHSSSYLSADEKVLQETLNGWLQWKGAVMEAQGRHLAAVAASGDQRIKKLFEDLTRTRREIAKLQAAQWSGSTFKDIKETLADKEKLRDNIEATLSGMSKGFALQKKTGKANTETILRILPKNAVYLDFAKTGMFDFQKQAWKEQRYLVFILMPGGEPSIALLDLGPSENVDRHIEAYLKAMGSAKSGYVPGRTSLDKEAGELYGLLMKPLEKYVSHRDRLFISPDGNLNLIPFEVLRDPRGSYSIERYQISYISAGRDVSRFEESGAHGDQGVTALVLADPDYDFGLGSPERKNGGGDREKTATSLPADKKNVMFFSRLPDTKSEADTIQKILTQKMGVTVRNYQNEKATESLLHSAESPTIVHLATHGYFIGKDETGTSSGVDQMLRDSPMFRSGLALAGINLSLREGRDEGIMSAEKVMGLKLTGTDLVVLSACETGVGDVEGGEGVFGLKRAFILSGARAVILSLWSVPSAETMELMTKFYSFMADGKSKAEALRQAKLDVMKNRPNPFFWGAFILVGNPG